jgi:hypothetical protein
MAHATRVFERASFTIVLLAVFACAAPAGLAPTPEGGGPRVVWDLAHRPLPEIPFPNDAATRPDPSSPTGRRLNLSLVAPTGLEGEVRERADRLDGFGTFSPITVKFDAPLDLPAIAARHLANRDFADDAVFLIDVQPGSPGFGQPVMLDLGRGFFPVTVGDPGAYFAGDPHPDGSSLVFADDNVLPPGGSPWDDLLTWYERETDTLILRPVVPLREETRYAVVVTRRVVGAETGEPVRSAFPWVNHADQTPALEPLRGILAQAPYGLPIDDVAFAWTFTTQTITRDLVAIREGLHGRGPLARLAAGFPADYRLAPLKTPEKAAATGSMYAIPIAELLEVAGPLLPLLGGMIPSLAESVDALIASYDRVEFMVGGYYKSPDFLVDRDGLAASGHPADDDEAFDVDPVTGAATYGTTDVPFVCVVPKERPDWADAGAPGWAIRRPFPVAIFMHGTAASKLQVLGYAGQLARMGVASCAIDGFSHGMPFPAIPAPGSLLSEDTIVGLIGGLVPGYEPVYPFMKGTRCRDLTMDGNLDPAGDFWTMDPFHTRDTIRQTVVDLVQFVRVLRAMDGTATADVDGDGTPDVLGDFDRDGKVDLGGPDTPLSAWGISLGGIVTGVLAGVEPHLDAAVVHAGGGGLTDVAIRSDQPGVPQMAILPVLGPLWVFEPRDGGGLAVRFAVPDNAAVLMLDVDTLASARPGDTVRLTNLDSGESRSAVVPASVAFRIQVAADALRPSEIRAYLGFDPLVRHGGEPCKVSADCPGGLPCSPGGTCVCDRDADCPAGLGCADTGKCVFRPRPVDTTLATASHPALGDRMRIEVLSPSGEVVETSDSFGRDVTVNGVVYPAGAPLVNLYRGFGYERQTPEFRRFIGIAQSVVEPGDPVNWARRWMLEPVADDVEPGATPGTNVMIIAGVGDMHVPVATHVALARAAGIVGYARDDPRFPGRSQMEVLVDEHAVEGLANRCRYEVAAKDKDGAAVRECVLADPDDLDGHRAVQGCDDCLLTYDASKPGVVTGWVCADAGGQVGGDGYGLPFDLPEPLRATVVPEAAGGALRDAHPACAERHADGTCRVFRDDRGVGGLRIAVTKPQGFHGMYLMSPQKPFDVETYQLDLIGRYFMTRGRELWDDPCLEDATCAWMP